MIVDIATGEVEDEVSPKKRAASHKGKSGGLKGGKARAQLLTPEQRQDIARLAARARWKKSD
jgi:Spy/CpxP family protein refolding chaperone